MKEKRFAFKYSFSVTKYQLHFFSKHTTERKHGECEEKTITRIMVLNCMLLKEFSEV